MDKSLSDSEVNLVGTVLSTPPNYVFQRVKRTREEIEETLSKQLDDFKLEIKKMMTLFSIQHSDEIKKVTTTLTEIQQSNLNIESSIMNLTAQNEELKKKILEMEFQTKEDKKQITFLENKIEDLQMGGRKTNFVIKNVPKKSNESKEDLIEMVLSLARTLTCNIGKYDIKDIYRVRGKNTDSQNTPIIVETGSTLLRTEILKMGKAYNLKTKTKLCCKHLGFKSQEDTPVFLSEHLTPKGSRLHFLARDLTRTGAYKFCWTAYGKVYIKKEEQAPTITITSEDQIHKLLLKQ